ncbi:hypothetical protein ACVGVM_23665 [Pseudonocardia bannensis]|uniref:Uncharacterized protein n=1 Tax=Pseudonocardia bannensis TaxID=630973 RepID=A0A848DQM2_9PSEU|nr:hypothetical protein [Pseudonocardia bannensis]NMH94845.1 hypothetical protein [Pseudonocardia bannensis]
MTDVSTFQLALSDARPADRDREGTAMLLHEALARSRQQEAEAAARRHRLARQLSAGRRWALLARYAERRAERARHRLRVV